MTDKELLEAAAKAAGIVLRFDADGPMQVLSDEDGEFFDDWNPLQDDGDAFRLAVNLKIHVSPMIATWWEKDGTEHEFENDRSDPMEDTRRAIVRAAAEIGKHS